VKDEGGVCKKFAHAAGRQGIKETVKILGGKKMQKQKRT
jgi:hypothetical protein